MVIFTFLFSNSQMNAKIDRKKHCWHDERPCFYHISKKSWDEYESICSSSVYVYVVNATVVSDVIHIREIVISLVLNQMIVLSLSNICTPHSIDVSCIRGCNVIGISGL